MLVLLSYWRSLVWVILSGLMRGSWFVQVKLQNWACCCILTSDGLYISVNHLTVSLQFTRCPYTCHIPPTRQSSIYLIHHESPPTFLASKSFFSCSSEPGTSSHRFSTKYLKNGSSLPCASLSASLKCPANTGQLP